MFAEPSKVGAQSKRAKVSIFAIWRYVAQGWRDFISEKQSRCSFSMDDDQARPNVLGVSFGWQTASHAWNRPFVHVKTAEELPDSFNYPRLKNTCARESLDCAATLQAARRIRG
jgi:hypothetical protein